MEAMFWAIMPDLKSFTHFLIGAWKKILDDAKKKITSPV